MPTPTNLNLSQRNLNSDSVHYNESSLKLCRVNIKILVGNYLVFHYTREFINTIRETEPTQFRNEVRGALGKAAHYRDVPSEANVRIYPTLLPSRSRFFKLIEFTFDENVQGN